MTTHTARLAHYGTVGRLVLGPDDQVYELNGVGAASQTCFGFELVAL